MKILVSYFPHITSKRTYRRRLEKILHDIIIGEWKSEIRKLRELLSEGKIEEYKKLKQKLPAVAFSAICQGGHSIKHLIKYNQILIIDIDDISKKEVLMLNKTLSKDKFTFAIWISPSDRGLKMLVKTNASLETHKLVFNQYAKYLQDKFKIQVDKSGSDPVRLCYVSYDPNLILNLNAEVFELRQEKVIEKTSQIKEIDTRVDKYKASIIVEDIIRFLEKEHLSITNTHNEWYRVAYSLAYTFDYDLGKKYFLAFCRLDGSNHSEESSLKEWEYCFQYKDRDNDKITFGTLIHYAVEQGYKYPKIYTFWNIVKKKERESIIINDLTFIKFLEQNGIYRFLIDKTYIIIKVTDQIIDEVALFNVKDLVKGYIEKLPYEISEFLNKYHLLNKIIVSNSNYFNRSKLEFLSNFINNLVRDSASVSYVFFKNCFVKITSSTVEQYPYKKLKGVIWKITNGISILINSDIRSFSNVPNLLSAIRRTARSMLLITCMVFPILFFPSSPTSSTPAVSIIITGPMPKISTDFLTGSVVVPARSDTMATSCPVIILIKELFPLFLLPKIPICGLRSFPFFI